MSQIQIQSMMSLYFVAVSYQFLVDCDKISALKKELKKKQKEEEKRLKDEEKKNKVRIFKNNLNRNM